MKLAVLLALATSAAADIIYLAQCDAAGSSSGFGAAVFYTGAGAGSGQLLPSLGNIGIAGTGVVWGDPAQVTVIYPETHQVLTVELLFQSNGTVGSLAGF